MHVEGHIETTFEEVFLFLKLFGLDTALAYGTSVRRRMPYRFAAICSNLPPTRPTDYF
jgi:hypothetical protein